MLLKWPRSMTAVQNGVASVLKFAAVGGILAVGWLRRRVASEAFLATLGGAWVVFFVFAPGVGARQSPPCSDCTGTKERREPILAPRAGIETCSEVNKPAWAEFCKRWSGCCYRNGDVFFDH